MRPKRAWKRSSNKRENVQKHPTSQSFPMCFRLCSIAWIIVVLNLIFIRAAEFQAVYSVSLPWSVEWWKPVGADEVNEENHEGSGLVAVCEEEDAMVDMHAKHDAQENKDPFARPQHLQKCKCRSILTWPLLPMVCQVQEWRAIFIEKQQKCFENAGRSSCDSLHEQKTGCLNDVQEKENAEYKIWVSDPGTEIWESDTGRPAHGYYELETIDVHVDYAADEEKRGNEIWDQTSESNGREGNYGHVDSVDGTESSPMDNERKESHQLNLTELHVRQEPGDGPYNYASESKGAKILASNKEVKGASNILNKDKDKYMRTPCSAENKFVDLELSEETLIVTIVIANHEFYSSNVREVEFLGSSIYPTKNWTLLGRFNAENTRAPQIFSLQEPHWARYLRVQMLSHYGSDFYCTLSVLEVYGIDAIEWLLEDWIAEEEGGRNRIPPPPSVSHKQQDDRTGEKLQSFPMMVPERLALSSELDAMLAQLHGDIPDTNGKSVNYNFKDVGKIEKAQPRPAVDAVVKLLMQKVRLLEHNQPLLSKYMQDLNDRYMEIFRVCKKELAFLVERLDDAVVETSNLRTQVHVMEQAWREERRKIEANFSQHVMLWREDLQSLGDRLRWMENKELVALVVVLLSLLLVAMMQMVMICACLLEMLSKSKQSLRSWNQFLWVIPFMGCLLISFILAM